MCTVEPREPPWTGRRTLSGERLVLAGQRHSGGFTYIGMLIVVVILGVSLGAAGSLWSLSAQREKEVELLFIGHQFRNAIAAYYAAAGAGFRYPRELQNLVDDDRSPVPRHFLRQIYRDPITGKDDWNLIRTDDGEIIGVASSSIATPIKKANFEIEDAAFQDQECYCDWQFLYQPRRARVLRKP